MDGPEERPADAAKDAEEPVRPAARPGARPGSVPPPPSTALSRPLVMGALITAFVLMMAGVAVGGYLVVDRTFGEGKAASSERRVSVFLCAKTSDARRCRKEDATEQQKAEIKRRLDAMPQVRRVEYESREQAYASFKKRFVEDKELLEGVRPGDIPDSFRVRVADAEAAKAVKAAMDGVPGVDAVVIDPRKPRA
ncbi:permease-like cell division protein FtsX [Actinomadura sp. 1N219]|uniref:permease-like cell division protein FtsX n=1 Tax=Actinomadura sp. 1N219 TaxID=3375152 RepID=UPI003799AF9E